MYSTVIQIPRKLNNQLLAHAQQSPELEVCGLVSSLNGLAHRCYAIKNIAENAQRQFLLDSSEHIEAIKTMRERGETLFAIYHSHPHAPAIPSLKDLSLVGYAEVLYLIISLNTKGILEMRGFKINENRAEEVTLVLCE